jgi:hypothetical protein
MKTKTFDSVVFLRVLLSVLLCLILGSGLKGQESQNPQTWTSAQGKTIEADFVRLTDDGVVLKLRSTGQEAEVPFASLNLESHLQAIRLAKPEEFSKPLVKAVVKPAIDIPPLRQIDLDAVMVSPFSESQSLQEFIDTLSQQVEEGNLFVVWHAIPEKMQSDLITLAANGMEKIGDGPVLQIKTLMKDLNTVVSEKKDFLFNTPLLASNEEALADLQAKWPAIEQFISSVGKEELWQSENFKQDQMEQWLAKFLSAIGSNFDALDAIVEAEMPGVPQPTLAEVIQVLAEADDKGQIQFSNPAIPLPSDEKLTVRKVRGQWVVPLLMNNLRQAVDEGLRQIEDVDVAAVRTGIQTAMSTVIPPIGALARAETQEEFDAVIDSLTPLIESVQVSIPADLEASLTAAAEANAAAGGNANRGRRGGPGSNQRGSRGGSGRRSGGPGMGDGGN